VEVSYWAVRDWNLKKRITECAVAGGAILDIELRSPLREWKKGMTKKE